MVNQEGDNLLLNTDKQQQQYDKVTNSDDKACPCKKIWVWIFPDSLNLFAKPGQ